MNESNHHEKIILHRFERFVDELLCDYCSTAMDTISDYKSMMEENLSYKTKKESKENNLKDMETSLSYLKEILPYLDREFIRKEILSIAEEFIIEGKIIRIINGFIPIEKEEDDK